MYCTQCGKLLPDNAAFCTECGAELKPQKGFEVETKPKLKQVVSEKAPGTQTIYEGPSQGIQDKTYHFFANLFQRGTITITNRDVKINRPNNAILGIIPTGSSKYSFSASNINSVELQTSLSYSSFLVGIIFFILGVYVSLNDGGGIGAFLALLGIIFFALGIKTRFELSMGGKTFSLDVIFFERGKMKRVVDDIENVLRYVEDKDNLSLNAQNLAQANANAFKELLK